MKGRRRRYNDSDDDFIDPIQLALQQEQDKMPEPPMSNKSIRKRLTKKKKKEKRLGTSSRYNFNSNDYFSSCPFEIHHHIISYLDFPSLLSLASCSRQLHDEILKSSKLWHRLCISAFQLSNDLSLESLPSFTSYPDWMSIYNFFQVYPQNFPSYDVPFEHWFQSDSTDPSSDKSLPPPSHCFIPRFIDDWSITFDVYQPGLQGHMSIGDGNVSLVLGFVSLEDEEKCETTLPTDLHLYIYLDGDSAIHVALASEIHGKSSTYTRRVMFGHGTEYTSWNEPVRSSQSLQFFKWQRIVVTHTAKKGEGDNFFDYCQIWIDGVNLSKSVERCGKISMNPPKPYGNALDHTQHTPGFRIKIKNLKTWGKKLNEKEIQTLQFFHNCNGVDNIFERKRDNELLPLVKELYWKEQNRERIGFLCSACGQGILGVCYQCEFSNCSVAICENCKEQKGKDVKFQLYRNISHARHPRRGLFRKRWRCGQATFGPLEYLCKEDKENSKMRIEMYELKKKIKNEVKKEYRKKGMKNVKRAERNRDIRERLEKIQTNK